MYGELVFTEIQLIQKLILITLFVRVELKYFFKFRYFMFLALNPLECATELSIFILLTIPVKLTSLWWCCSCPILLHDMRLTIRSTSGFAIVSVCISFHMFRMCMEILFLDQKIKFSSLSKWEKFLTKVLILYSGCFTYPAFRYEYIMIRLGIVNPLCSNVCKCDKMDRCTVHIMWSMRSAKDLCFCVHYFFE